MKFYFSESANETSSRYYGWVIVGLTFITMAVGGSVVGTFPVFYVAFLDEFGWSRADTALAFSFSMATFAISAGFIGAMVDRWGPRVIIPTGITILAVGLALMSKVSSLPTLYLFYGGIVALGITMFGFIPTSTVVSQWFAQRRSVAMGISLSGRSCGGILMVPFSAYLIATFGWRTAYVFLAIGIIVLLVPLNMLLHRSRADIPPKMTGDDPESSWTLKEALSDSIFWLLFLAGIFNGVGFSVVGVHQAAHMVDVGMSTLKAASLIGGLAVVRALGGILGGWVGDRIGRSRTFYLLSLVAMSGVILLMNLSERFAWLGYAYVLVYGIGAGARGAIFVSLKADIFAGKSFGRILGVSQTGGGLASAVGPWIAGYIFDIWESYYWAFILVLCVQMLSLVAVAAASAQATRRKG
ncbi:MAG: MFS transporter [Nitrospinae bacterium]|nr:MFS transporter [Nitrospinota bacterium]